MPEDTKHGAGCTEFEALLSDAIEGRLTGAQKDSFDAHRRVCEVCGPLFADALAGRELLRSLEEVEPPAYLVHNILVATCGVVSTRHATAGIAGATPRGERLREWWDSWFTPFAAFVRQPRFAMSFGMIFFSFSLALSVAGVKASDLAKISLRPSAVRHAYNDAQIKVVQYYDNIRFVYEIESKVRELKRATAPAEPAPQPEPKSNRKNDTSGQPEQRQDRNYSMEQGQMILAAFHGPHENCTREAATFEPRATSELLLARHSQLVTRSNFPAVTLSTNRRFV
ncbi:MAG: anti-sigma factor family protein [Terriglobales bacterium]